MKLTKLFFFGSLAALLTGALTSVHAEGLFAKVGQQSERVVAVFDSLWDDFFGKLDELLVADVNKEDGTLKFDAEKGIASFPVVLKVNMDAYAQWETNAWKLLEACGIQEDSRGKWRFGRKRFALSDADADAINRAAAAGELALPGVRAGVIVKLVDEKGGLVQYAAFPLGLFGKPEESSHGLPEFLRLDMLKDNCAGICFYDNNEEERENIENRLRSLKAEREAMIRRGRSPGGLVELEAQVRRELEAAIEINAESLSISFAGVTKQALSFVADIVCEVLVAPDFEKECIRLSKEKIDADSALFAQHGIETKVITLPGGVPLALNKTPRGTWFSRYEVTQGQWSAVMGDDNPSIKNRQKSDENEGFKTTLEIFNHLYRHPFHCVLSPDMPVDYIAKYQAISFIQRLNALPEVQATGLEFKIPDGYYFDLNNPHDPQSPECGGNPEWEYACIGAEAFDVMEMERQGINFGLDLEGNKMKIDETGWSGSHSDGPRWPRYIPHPVGMKRPNAFGLYDMIGNASEFVVTAPERGEYLQLKHKCGRNANKYLEDYGYRFAAITLSDRAYACDGFRLFARPRTGSSSSSSSSGSVPSGKDGDDDSELAQLMKKTGMEFTLTTNGYYSAKIDMKDGRTQEVKVRDKVREVGSLKVLEVWSVIKRSEKRPIDVNQMEFLLSKSNAGKYGLTRPAENAPGNWVLFYQVYVPVTSKLKDVAAQFFSCAVIADASEEALFNTDEN